jgi:PadR family transcriptional regulator PadR
VLSASTVYPLLARLKAEGLVEAEWVEENTVHPRKYYWLTADGRARAIEMTKVWSRFSGSLESLLSPLLKEGD